MNKSFSKGEIAKRSKSNYYSTLDIKEKDKNDIKMDKTDKVANELQKRK